MGFKLPNPDENVAVMPGISRDVVGYDVGTVADESARALQDVAAGLGGVGRDMEEAFVFHKTKADSAKKTSGINKLYAGLSHQTIGKDDTGKEVGYSYVKGEGATKPEYRKSYEEQSQVLYDGIKESLQNEDQKQMFEAEGKRILLRHKADLGKHVITQTDAFEVDTYNSTIATSVQQAQTYYHDDNLRVDHMNRGLREIMKYGVGNGKGREWIDSKAQEYLASIHAVVVDQAIKDENYAWAGTYMKKYGNEMDPGQKAGLKENLSTSLDSVAALTEANNFYNTPKTSGASNQEAKAHFNTKFSDQPKVAKAAYTEWSSLKTAELNDLKIRQINDRKALAAAYDNGTLNSKMILNSDVENPEVWLDRERKMKSGGTLAVNQSELGKMKKMIHHPEPREKLSKVDLKDKVWAGVEKGWWGVKEAESMDEKVDSETVSNTYNKMVSESYEKLERGRVNGTLTAGNKQEQEKAYGEYLTILGEWIDNHPGENPISFVDEIIIPAQEGKVGWVLDTLWIGEPFKEEAFEEKKAGLQKKAKTIGFDQWAAEARKATKEQNPGASDADIDAALKSHYDKTYGGE